MLFIEPSEEETASVTNLKSQLTEEMKTTHFTDVKVLRFLRGRNHDQEKTLKGLKKHIEWRKEFKVDNLIKDTTEFDEELSQRKLFNAGADLKGRPIVCLIVRRHNKDKRDIKHVQRTIIHCLEVAMAKVNASDEKILFVFDLAQFSLSCMDYEVVKVLVHVLQYNYPEILSAALIVNSPLIFSACWAMIKIWIDPVTAAKCQFIRPGQLTDFIDISEIPEEVFGVVRAKSEDSAEISVSNVAVSVEESYATADGNISEEHIVVSKITETEEDPLPKMEKLSVDA